MSKMKKKNHRNNGMVEKRVGDWATIFPDILCKHFNCMQVLKKSWGEKKCVWPKWQAIFAFGISHERIITAESMPENIKAN